MSWKKTRKTTKDTTKMAFGGYGAEWNKSVGNVVGGFKKDFMEQGLPSCVRYHFEHIHWRGIPNLRWQFISVRDYLNAEGM